MTPSVQDIGKFQCHWLSRIHRNEPVANELKKGATYGRNTPKTFLKPPCYHLLQIQLKVRENKKKRGGSCWV